MPNETRGFVTKNSAKSRKLSRAVVSCVVNTRKKCHFPRWGCSVFTSHKSAYSSKVSIYVALWLTALCTPCRDQTAAPQPVISLVNHSDQNWNALFFLFLSFNEVFWSKNKIPSKRTEAAVVLNHTLNQFKTAELLDIEKVPVCIGKITWFKRPHNSGDVPVPLKSFLADSPQSWGLGWLFWCSPSVPIACSRQDSNLFQVWDTLPIKNTPILEKVQKDNVKNSEKEKKK